MSYDEEVLAGIAAIGREKLGLAGAVGRDSRLASDLGLDSLQLLTLAVEIENRFEICLDEEDEAGLETVGDLVRLIVAKRTSPEALE